MKAHVGDSKPSTREAALLRVRTPVWLELGHTKFPLSLGVPHTYSLGLENRADIAILCLSQFAQECNQLAFGKIQHHAARLAQNSMGPQDREDLRILAGSQCF